MTTRSVRTSESELIAAFERRIHAIEYIRAEQNHNYFYLFIILLCFLAVLVGLMVSKGLF